MGIGRRRFLVGTAKVVTLGTALGSPGIYELVDLVSGNRIREALAAPSLPAEQHLMQQLPVINVNPGGVQATGSDTVPVLVPPLHFQVSTAKLTVPATAVALLQAQQFLE